MCRIIAGNAIIGQNSGGHIHVGTQVIGEKMESWLNFIQLWAVYENIIYRFSYGEFLTARSSIKYAEPVSAKFFQDYQMLKENCSLSIDELISKISQSYQAINFCNVVDFRHIAKKNTIEFRCPNGTLDPVIWQNNVNFFVKLLQYSKSSRYNDDIIQKRKRMNQGKYTTLDTYNYIYLEQALELCDLLFTNNLDKVYFLRQYLKSFEISNQNQSKSKPFTKR